MVAGAFDLSNRLVTALPPAFLVLVLMNMFFLGMVLWFLDAQAKQRSSMVEKMVDRCMEIALHANPPPPKD